MAAEAVTATIAETPDHGWIEKLVVWTIVLFAGQANVFTRSLDSWQMVAAPVFFLGVHLILAWRADVRFDRRYLYIVGGFTLYFIATTWKFKELHPRFWGIYVVSFTCVYIALRAMGRRFFARFEQVLTTLSLIALGFWVIQLLMPSVVLSILSTLEFFRSSVTLGGVNGLVYSVQLLGETIPRNCGFAWEPGGYASILVFGIFVNLIHHKLRWQGNRSLAIYLAALITTQSTTGWATAGILLIWFVSRQRLWPLWLAGAVPVITLAIAHPMMGEKIMESIEKDDRQTILQSIDNAYEYETIYTPQRFASFQISWEDFRRNPWLGFAGHDVESWASRERIRINVVTGLGEILRRFGAIGMAFFLVMSWISAHNLVAGTPGARWTLFSLILAVGFSYAQILQPLFMMFWMAGQFLLSGDRLDERPVEPKFYEPTPALVGLRA